LPLAWPADFSPSALPAVRSPVVAGAFVSVIEGCGHE
jgi:hypothetical protein